MNDIKSFVEPFITYDNPVEYEGLKVYAIRVKDWLRFISAYDILAIDKTQISDVEIIQMSYLQYMMQLIIADDRCKDMFLTILDLCFHVRYDDAFYNKDFDKNEVLSFLDEDTGATAIYINGYNMYFFIENKYRVSIYIDGHLINATQFNDVIKIIQFQNFYDFDDTVLSDDVRKVIEQYYAIKNKGKKMPSLDTKIISVMAKLSYTKNEIKEMDYRTFNKIFAMMLEDEDYNISHLYKVQGADINIEHWVYKEDKPKYSEVFSSADEFRRKIESI